jgi:dienelactone hydrolase
LAIDLRGFGQSKRDSQTQPPDDGQQLDVLAAVRYLRQTGSKTVSVVGGSMGGVAAAEASAACAPDEIDRVAMIASEGIEQPEKMKGRKLFITCRDDLGPGDKPSLDKIREHYRRAPEPKELVILTGIVAANKKVKQAQCAHNVGEFGLAVQVFVTDNHVYPLVVNPKYFKSAYPEHQTVWTTALQGILARGDLVHPNSTNDQGEGIWVCPAASRPDSFPDSLVFVSYGYNDDGLSTRETSLGLGGQNIWPGRPDGSFSN